MKKIYTPLITIILATVLFSCKKNIVEKKLLYGHWKYTKAERVNFFSQNESRLFDYEDIEIFIDYNENFVWTEGNKEWYGTIEHSEGNDSESDNSCDSHDDLIFWFDDGSSEVWHDFSARKRKNIMKYEDDTGLQLELTKQVEKTRRRNGDPVVNPDDVDGKG